MAYKIPISRGVKFEQQRPECQGGSCLLIFRVKLLGSGIAILYSFKNFSYAVHRKTLNRIYKTPFFVGIYREVDFFKRFFTYAPTVELV